MSEIVTLADYLAKAGVKTASAPVTAAAPVAAAPVAAPVAAPAKAAAVAPVAAPAAAPVAAPAAPVASKTAAQTALEAAGVIVADPKVAEILYASQLEQQKQAKVAEMQAVNAEYEARGALATHGQIKESMAIAIACGEKVTRAELVKAAAVTGCTPSEILARAGEHAESIKKAELAAAEPTSKFFLGHWGAGAREGEVLAAAERNGSTTVYDAPTAPAMPASGVNPEQLRFTQAVTLPGNKDLNHGQPVDGGKGLSN